MAPSVIADDPFRSYLTSLFLAFEGTTPGGQLPKYNGPCNWQTDSILVSLGKIFERLTGSSQRLIPAARPAQKPLARSLPPYTAPPTPRTDASSTPTSSSSKSSRTSMSIELPSVPEFCHKSSFGGPLTGPTSAPVAAFAEYIDCPTCSGRVTDTGMISKIALFSTTLSPGSPSVVAKNGPLETAARESGMNAVDELRLLKSQVQDVARVCNAVARGDLSQQITVEVRSEVMVNLKDAINTMVRRPPILQPLILSRPPG